jgi:hypothetical protein
MRFIILFLCLCLTACSTVQSKYERGKIDKSMSKKEIATEILYTGTIDDDPWLDGCFREYFSNEKCEILSGRGRETHLVFCDVPQPTACSGRDGNEKLHGVYTNYAAARQAIKELNISKATNFDVEKSKCKQLGFTEGTEAFGNCVLKLMK